VLLQQLAAARRQSLELRDQLLRAKHHTPIVIGSPLDTALISAAAWLMCAVLAVACGAIYAHSRSSIGKAAARIKQLRQALKINDALWRRDFGKEQAKAQQLEVQLQQHKQREAAWRHSVEQTAQDLNQRAAALQGRSPSAPGHALLVSKC
jgi:septal ring factor EnvC (AmiA/AmiB activator)